MTSEIQPTPDSSWLESARIWALGVPSGTGKTPVFKAAKQPIEIVEKEWMDEDRGKRADYERAKTAHDGAYKDWKTATQKGENIGNAPEEPEAPPERQIIVNDMTMEALATNILVHNPRGVLLVYDEIMRLFGGFDAYNKGKKDRRLSLESWNGSQHTVNRKGEGLVRVPNLSTNVLGGIQEDKLREHATSLTSDGLFQRFLVASIKNEGKPEYRDLDKDAVGAYHYK